MTIKNVPNVTHFSLRKTVKKVEFKDTSVLIVNIGLEVKNGIN